MQLRHCDLGEDSANLFTNFARQRFKVLTKNKPPSLPNLIRDLLTPFSDGELHDAAQKLASKGSTAPGPDGWSYQTWYKSWSISGDFLVNLANHIFQHPDSVKEPQLSSIIIRLLPKDKFDPQSPDVNHLRPVSLTNTSIRIIMFAFTPRLLPCFTRIISSLQQANFYPTPPFIPSSKQLRF
ncbi:unnamed protein product [Ambrosiozyma monospora]|uniref:Unnamed protein product n=1 Tax=Ambrosiozyma monospora TaxID=43982 RepID=A0A9W7DGN7_AMBMO|nr:unnamed protein product [Ambrosiozyma monospora]